MQFDVIQTRLASEYGVQCLLEPAPYVAARWPVTGPAFSAPVKLPYADVVSVRDRRDRDVLLFASSWALSYYAEHNPHVRLHESL